MAMKEAPSAYSSGMRGSEKKKAPKVSGVHIEKTANGHAVNTVHDYIEGSSAPYMKNKPTHFKDGEESEMFAHVAKTLGVKHNPKNSKSGASDEPEDEE